MRQGMQQSAAVWESLMGMRLWAREVEVKLQLACPFVLPVSQASSSTASFKCKNELICSEALT